MKIEEEVGSLLSDLKLTISIAESCTGGGICSRISRVPGSSNYFLGGIVSYSHYSKIKHLGISSEMISRYGDVSEQVALAMVDSVRNKFQSDISLSITGFSGPSGDRIGQVFISILSPKNRSCYSFQFEGCRETITNQSIEKSLSLILSEIKLIK